MPGEAPASYAVRAAAAKAVSLLPLLSGPEADGFFHFTPPQDGSIPLPSDDQNSLPSNAVIMAADTVVALDGRILGKPRDPEEALEFLRLLSGTTHEVITGCALEGNGLREHFACRTLVSMWKCPDELLAAYATGGEPMDKAGAYAIQGEGAVLVDSIQGSWSNVVGLPLAEIIQALLRMGAVESVSAARHRGK
jgi:septum formation protein